MGELFKWLDKGVLIGTFLVGIALLFLKREVRCVEVGGRL